MHMYHTMIGGKCVNVCRAGCSDWTPIACPAALLMVAPSLLVRDCDASVNGTCGEAFLCGEVVCQVLPDTQA